MSLKTCQNCGGEALEIVPGVFHCHDCIVKEDEGDLAMTEDIKSQRFEDLRGREVVILVKHDYGWRVEQWLEGDGVAPPCDYDTPQEAAARACQLLKLTEPVKPQDWPEIAQIGGDGRSPPPRT